jgi:ABC-type nitrate/sulfonate/bicarbonate transport system permease component
MLNTSIDFYRKNSRPVNKILSIVAGLALWHFLATVVVADTSFLVSPIAVVAKGYEMLFVSGELYPHIFASSTIFLNGYLLSIVVGVPLGFLMAFSPAVRDYVHPWMTTLYTTPRIAFAPVLLLWLGIGAGSKVAIVFLGCVFPSSSRARSGSAGWRFSGKSCSPLRCPSSSPGCASRSAAGSPASPSPNGSARRRGSVTSSTSPARR